MANTYTIELYRRGKYWLRFCCGETGHGKFWAFESDDCGGCLGEINNGCTSLIARQRFQTQLDRYKMSGINLIRCPQ